MKVFNYVVIMFICSSLLYTQSLNAQTSCIGGGNIIVEPVCIEMLAGGEVGDEEITILTTITDNMGNTLVNNDCAQEDADLGSGGTSSMLGPGFSTMNIPIPYTPGGNYGDNNDFPSTIDICFTVFEDDGGGRCVLDTGGGIFANDDDDDCSTCTPVDIASIWGTGGACSEALNSDGSVDACTVNAPNIFRVNCGGDWIITYQVYLDLAPPVELTCPGFMSPTDAPITLSANESGTTNLLSGGTWSVLSGGGSIVDNGDGTSTFDPAGTTPGTSVQVAYTGDNCCQTIETTCFISIVECPALDVVTMDGDGCIGDNVTLTATITPATAVENQNYVLVWQEDGVDIPGASSAGPDGVPGTADDISTQTYVHTLPGAGVDGCTSAEHTYTAQLYCITNFTLQEGDPNMANASTDPADTVIPYNASGPTCIDLDLSTLPACALAGSFDYSTVVTSGPPFGNSWICEAILEVQTPVGNQGPFCDAFYGGACPTTNSGNSCFGGPTGAGTNTFSGNSSFGGLTSTTPAQGTWSACFSDSFNDTGSTEGVVNYILLDIQALLPPGCSINGAGSMMDATNIGSPANNPAAVTVCTAPVLGTDFMPPSGCDNFAITDLCGTLEIGYATSAAGPFDTALADATTLVTPTNGEMVFYEIRLPGCPDCAITAGSWTLMGCCSVTEPTTTDDAVCEGQSGTLTATPGMNCTTVNWFSDAAGNTMVGTGTSFSPSDTAPGTVTYYAQCVDSSIADCESMLIPADYTINALPVVTLATPALACGAGPQSLNPSPTGGTYSGLGAPFVSNDAIDGEDLVVGVTYNLTYTFTTPEGCTNSTMITFTFTPDCDANGGSFPNTGP